MTWLIFYFAGWFLLLGASTASLVWRRGSQPLPLPVPLPRVSILIAAWGAACKPSGSCTTRRTW